MTPYAGGDRLLVAHQFKQRVIVLMRQLAGIKRGGAGEQLVQQRAQRVDVAAGVDVVDAAECGLFRAHILQSAEDHADGGHHGFAIQFGVERLGETEVDDLGNSLAFDRLDKDVRRLNVAVDDALLVRVVDGLADGNEELDALANVQLVFVAVAGDGRAVDELHHKVRQALRRRTGVENLGDVGMFHQGQGAAFAFKAGNDGL